MKKVLSIILTATILLSSFVIGSSASASGNIEYLDFESATAGSPVTGWISNVVGLTNSSSDPAEIGTTSGQLNATTEWYGAYYNTAYTLVEGKKYELTAWINHAAYTPKTDTDAYVGFGMGVFLNHAFSGASSVCSDGKQTFLKADGSQALATVATQGNNSYFNMSTKSAGELARGVWYKAILTFTAKASTNVAYITLRGNNGTNTILFDNVTLREVVAANITINAKESAAVIPVGSAGAPSVGDTYKFKVSSMDTSPEVTVNGSVVTPDANGVYSVVATENTNITVVCDGDENRPLAGFDEFGNDLKTYQNNSEVYLKSAWNNGISYHEVAMFYSGRQTVKLLYPIDSIVSLRSYDLKTYYVEGVDYEITADGEIKILPGSHIPVYPNTLTTSSNTGWASDTAGTYVTIIGDTTFPTTALSITYKHSKKWSDLGKTGYTGTKPESQVSDLSRTIAKLEAGEDVNIVIYGDSISCGWSSSGLNNPNTEFKVYNEDCVTLALTNNGTGSPYVINVPPYAPTWIEMFVWELRERYPDSNINVSNLSLGGKNSTWGIQQIATRMQKLCTAAPDLVLIGWGVNDANNNGTSAATFKANNQSIINTIRNASTTNGNPNADILLFSPMIPNTTLANYDASFLLAYETALAELSDKISSVGLVKLTSIFDDIGKSKQQVDYLNTNLNHPNDFGARVFATSILEAMYVPTQAEIDQEAANVVIQKIAAIGTVTLSSKTAIEQAEAAYVALTEAQKALVTNYDVLVEARLAYNALVPPVAAGDINGDTTVDLKDVTTLSRYVAGWQGLTYEESVLDTNGDGTVDLKDVTLLSRYIAGWDVELAGGNASQAAIFKLQKTGVMAGQNFGVPISLTNFSKLGGDIAGYQFTVTFDSTKVEFLGYTPAAAWASDANVTTAGTAVVVADNNNNSTLTITANGLIGTLNFKAKSNATGLADIVLTINEIANSSAVSYAPGKAEGSSITVSFTSQFEPMN